MNANAPIKTSVTEMERYLFDLNGYLILKGALSASEVDQMNETYDRVEEHARTHQGRSWYGNVLISNSGRQEGIGMQQLYEAGPVWENLIDHPSWFDKIKHFIGTDDPENFDGHHGPAFIDECFGTIRVAGDAQRLHSGGHVGTVRTQYRFHAGKFHCGQVNILMAMTDIGPGDGATMVVPGSHKSNIAHPQTVPVEKRADDSSSMDGVEGAIEAHLEKGDALLFVDAIAHGSARRTNEQGQRRVAVYRYGPSWGFFRLPVRPSKELLERLPEQRRKIVMPHPDPLVPESA
ncbi:MAG: phytanoyl-CoA dioxygenase family protein [Hyphomicrobiaceae bacterium]|nr:phytanoyl-CoA dioxygenase family protein [Hyphomicrobiaceae bacterium]